MTAEVLEVRRRLAVLSERPTSVSPAETRALRRARIVARIGEVVEEATAQRRVQTRRRWALGAGALALAAGAALVVGRGAGWWGEADRHAFRAVDLRGAVLCQSEFGDSWGPCPPGGLSSGMGLRTLEQAAATLETHIGVRLELGSLATLGLTELAPARSSTSVTLRQGRLAVEVPHLQNGAEFSVVTPSATVVVHGTAFVVEVVRSEAGEARTCVRVTEGVVSVRHAGGEQWVSAHGSWGCDHPQPLAELEAAPPRTESSPPRQPAPRAPSGTAEHSTLGLEAHLLQTALGAERRGDFGLAERTLVSLLTSYPNSVIAPDAQAALARVRQRQRERVP